VTSTITTKENARRIIESHLLLATLQEERRNSKREIIR
jgi:hypothetical protein